MLLAAVYVVAFAASICLRPKYLPSLALVILALIPVAYLAPIGYLTTFSPSLLVLVVWLWRARPRPKLSGYESRWGIPEFTLLAATIALVVVSAVNGSLTIAGWTVSVVVSMSLIPLLGRRRSATGITEIGPTWALLAAAVGLYSVFERVLEFNPLYGSVFAESAQFLIQKWSVYRSTATVGHPLLLAAFLAGGVAIAVGLYIQTQRWMWLIIAAIAVAGTVATGSRSGLLSIGAASIAMILIGLVRRSRSTARSVILVAPISIVVGAVALSALSARLVSDEASASSEYRDMLYAVGSHFVEEAPLTGLGTEGLGESAMRAGLFSGGNFENSWLELCIAFGYIVAIALAAVLIFYLFRATMSRNLAATGLVMSLIASALSFNMLFGHPASILMIGIALMYCSAPGAAVSLGRERIARQRFVRA